MPLKVLVFVAGVCGAVALFVLFFNIFWYVMGKRAEAAGRRPSLVPVAAPLMAALGALFAWNRWAIAAAVVVFLVDPGSWGLLRHGGGRRSEEPDR